MGLIFFIGTERDWDGFFVRIGKSREFPMKTTVQQNKNEFFLSYLSASKTCSDFDELQYLKKKIFWTYGMKNVIEHSTPITNVIGIHYQFKNNNHKNENITESIEPILKVTTTGKTVI